MPTCFLYVLNLFISCKYFYFNFLIPSKHGATSVASWDNRFCFFKEHQAALKWSVLYPYSLAINTGEFINVNGRNLNSWACQNSHHLRENAVLRQTELRDITSHPKPHYLPQPPPGPLSSPDGLRQKVNCAVRYERVKKGA